MPSVQETETHTQTNSTEYNGPSGLQSGQRGIKQHITLKVLYYLEPFLHFNGHFPGEPKFAGSHQLLLPTVQEEKPLGTILTALMPLSPNQ